MRQRDPSGRDCDLVERDCAMTEALTIYETLPTNHLIAFDKRYPVYARKRLTQFYDDLSEAQEPIKRVRKVTGQQTFNAIGTYGPTLLKDYHKLDDDTHRWMAKTRIGRGKLSEHNAYACIYMAQIHLAAQKHGVRFVTHHDIIRKSPAKDKLYPLSIPVRFNGEETSLIPDAVFGLQYPDQTYKFFAFEYDRGSESVETNEGSSWGRKFHCYKDVQKRLDQYLGIPEWNILALIPHVPKKRNHPKSVYDLACKMNVKNFYYQELPENPHFDNVPKPSDDLFLLPWKGTVSDITLGG